MGLVETVHIYWNRAVLSQAIVLKEHGGPEKLLPCEIQMPSPAAGDVRIKHLAIRINFMTRT